MTLKECYDAFYGSYDDALERLMSEDLIRKYLSLFLEDDSFELLTKGLDENDDQKAFMAAHTLKGLALNLDMTALARSASDLTEALRGGRKPEADDLYEACKADYERTVGAIRAMLSE